MDNDVGYVYTHTMEYYSAIKEKEILSFCSNIDAPAFII